LKKNQTVLRRLNSQTFRYFVDKLLILDLPCLGHVFAVEKKNFFRKVFYSSLATLVLIWCSRCDAKLATSGDGMDQNFIWF
jgi:hypothetical protein